MIWAAISFAAAALGFAGIALGFAVAAGSAKLNHLKARVELQKALDVVSAQESKLQALEKIIEDKKGEIERLSKLLPTTAAGDLFDDELL